MGIGIDINVSSARDALAQLKTDLQKSGVNIGELIDKIDSLGKTMKNMADSFKASGNKVAESSFRELKKEADELKKGLVGASKESKVSEGSTKKLGKEVERLGKSNEYANKSLEAHKKTIEKVTSSSEKNIKKIKEQKDELAKGEKTTKSATKTAASYDLQLSENMETAKKTNKQIDLLSEKNKKLAKTNQSLGGTVSYLKTQTQELKRQLSSTNTELFRSGKANLDLQKKISTVTNQIQKHKKENKELKGELSSLRGESTRLKADVVSLTSAYWKQGKTILNLQKNNSSLTNQLKRTKTELASAVKTARLYDAELARLMRQNERLVKSNEKYKESIKKIRNEQRSMHDSMNKIMKIASTFRNVMFLGSIAMSWKYLAQDIIEVGSEFELLMKQVGAASGAIEKGFVSADFGKLRDLALKLGETTEYTSIQSAEAMKHLAMAGFNTRQMYATLPGVLDLATAGQIELGEAAEFATGALTSMGLITADTTQLTKNLERVNNALVFSAVQTNVSVQDLAESFKYVAPQAKNMGMSIEDLTIWLGLLGNANIKASSAGTQMSFALMRQTKAMKALNMNVAGSSFLDMINKMNKEGWGAEQINEVFTARGSRMILSIKSMVPVFERLRDAQKDAGKYAKELAEVMRDSTTVNLQKFTSLINNIKIEGFNQGSRNLNSSLKSLYSTVSLNRKELEKVAKGFVDTASFVMNFLENIVDATVAVKKFYDENQLLVESLSALVAVGAAWAGSPIIASLIGVGTFGAHQTKEQFEDIHDEVKTLTKELENLKKAKEAIDNYDKAKSASQSNPSLANSAKLVNARTSLDEGLSGLGRSFLKPGGYTADGKFDTAISSDEVSDRIKKAEGKLKSNKDRLKALIGENRSFITQVENSDIETVGSLFGKTAQILSQNIKSDLEIAKDIREDADLTKMFAEEFFRNTRESTDILQRAIGEVDTIEKDIEKLGEFRGKIGANGKGELKYKGSQSLESQKKALSKGIEDETEELDSNIKFYRSKAKEYNDAYFDMLDDYKKLGNRPLVGFSTVQEREAWDKEDSKIQALRANKEQYTASALIEQKKIDKLREKSAMEGAMLDKQISERNYNNLKSGVDAVRSSENEILNTRKQYFEEYGSWSLKSWKKYNDQEIDLKINAQRDKISDMKAQYSFQDPDKRMPIEKFQQALGLQNQILASMQKNAKIEKEIDARRKAEDVRRTEYDAIKDSENALYDMKKSNYESYQIWSAARTKEFRRKEVQKEIDVQKEVLKRMDKDQLNRVGGLSKKQYLDRRGPEQAKLDELNRSRFEKANALDAELINTQIQRQVSLRDEIKDVDDQIFEIKKANAEELDIFSNKNAQKFYKEELDRAIETEKQKRDLWLATEVLKSNSDPTKKSLEEISYLYNKMGELIKLKVKKNNKDVAKMSEVSFADIGANIKSTMSSSLSGVFEDTLKGELDSFSSYFKSFTDGLGSMWSSMAADMVINQKSFAGMSGLASAGLMGAAGIGIMGISSVLSSREAKKAEKARKAALRQQLSSELGDSIASLELSDAGYQIYQLNDRIKELTAQAKDAGYPMDQIIKLRKLETEEILKNIKAQYESASTSMTDFVTGVIREDWSLADWQAQYDKLHLDLLALDENGINYQEDSIDILNQQFEALQEIYNIQKDQLNALEGLNDSLTSQIWGLQNTGNAPTSLTNFKAQYESLRGLATTRDSSGFLNEDAISNFQDFVQEYIDVFSAAGYDYQDVVSGVVGDLSDLQIDVQTESAKLTEAIKANTNALEGNDGVINAITNLANITQEIANREIYKAWKTSGASAATATGEIKLGQFSANRETSEAYLRSSYLTGWYGSLSDELKSKYKIPEIPGFTYFSDPSKDFDFNSDGHSSTQEMNVGIDRLKSEYSAIMDWYNTVKDISAFAKGGYATTPSIAGEAGPEWVVPAYNNPNNENFLKSVGMDSGVIGSQIGVIVADKVSKAIYNALSNMTLNSDNQGDIVVKINEKEIARATLSQMKNNPSEYKRVLQ